MMASVFLSRVIGLLREMAIAYMAGAGKEVDAYQIAFILPEILNHVVATGFLSVTFIPLFTRHLVRDTETEAWRVFSIILCVFGSLALGVVARFHGTRPAAGGRGGAGPGRAGDTGRGRAHDAHHSAGAVFLFCRRAPDGRAVCTGAFFTARPGAPDLQPGDHRRRHPARAVARDRRVRLGRAGRGVRREFPAAVGGRASGGDAVSTRLAMGAPGCQRIPAVDRCRSCSA